MSACAIPYPALVPVAGGAVIAQDGACRRVSRDDARRLFRSGDVLLAHAVFVSGRLRSAPARAVFDVLELFAFVRPAQPCIPSPLGLARALGLELPQSAEGYARALIDAADLLLNELAALNSETKIRLSPLAASLQKAGWRWGAPALTALGEPEPSNNPIRGFEAWRGLREWEDSAAPDRPSAHPVGADEAIARLRELVGDTHEARPEQGAYSEAASYAFGPRETEGAPKIALIEAGTGTGKTLGYLAPASVWAEKNGPGLWLSTYTRNLQRQIMQEIARLYPDPAERNDKAVVRKGRENYLCLLNFEEGVKRNALAPGQRAVALGLTARWISATPDGDVSGAGFPAFLAASMPLREITDRRGECIYSACPHYRTCFIEKVIRRARHAPIVVANHALVIAQSAQDWLSTDQTQDTPAERRTRYVFDEGHHLFDAADSGFAAQISGQEMAELRRWIRGPERGARTRMKGLQERIRDLIEDDDQAREALDEAMAAAGALAGDGWLGRVSQGGVRGPGEAFLAAAYEHVLARNDERDGFYNIEAGTETPGETLLAAARELGHAFDALAKPLARLGRTLRKQIADGAEDMEPSTKARITAAAQGIERRAKLLLPWWIAMLDQFEGGVVSDEHAQWFEIARDDGRDIDVGLERHWIDPTLPLAGEVLAKSHGAVITSATLRDADPGADDWASAEVRTGALHLPEPPKRACFGSPFAYAEQSRIFIVRDVNKREIDEIASAYRELFLAAGGGGLGLFTAVRTLRAVEQRIAEPLSEAGINLYAQHVDRLDTGALVDLFRAEENACLLGTDALRDGVDVPGRSLRLVVFDKVPWPKPTILHKARRQRFGKSYDDLLTRLRLKQAFGRLIRGREDKGVFVILEPATPSRLLSAFPPDAPVVRCGLAEAIGEVRDFLSGDLVKQITG
ncbi:MAG TPA: ATP-dependent DNA helicase [Rhizomicrobium sp.]|jgi:ATP-dependent DNA helicase DinG